MKRLNRVRISLDVPEVIGDKLQELAMHFNTTKTKIVIWAINRYIAETVYKYDKEDHE